MADAMTAWRKVGIVLLVNISAHVFQPRADGWLSVAAVVSFVCFAIAWRLLDGPSRAVEGE